ncbi:hypothetical protein PG988_007849 [Apiospora saccharicola]
MVREAFEERFRASEKQQAGLDKWPLNRGSIDESQEDDATTEVEDFVVLDKKLATLLTTAQQIRAIRGEQRDTVVTAVQPVSASAIRTERTGNGNGGVENALGLVGSQPDVVGFQRCLVQSQGRL